MLSRNSPVILCTNRALLGSTQVHGHWDSQRGLTCPPAVCQVSRSPLRAGRLMSVTISPHGCFRLSFTRRLMKMSACQWVAVEAWGSVTRMVGFAWYSLRPWSVSSHPCVQSPRSLSRCLFKICPTLGCFFMMQRVDWCIVSFSSMWKSSFFHVGSMSPNCPI